MKILFCTDGSNISFNAIKNFSHWCKNASVDILCVIDWSFLPDSVSIEDSNFALQCTNSADNILNSVEHKLSEYGILSGEKLKVCGSVVDSIVEICEKQDYDFVVLGSHGKKGIQKWLGSVSQEIAGSVNNPIYIAKQANNRENVLFALDNSDVSISVIEKSINSLNFENKKIHLMTVYEFPDYLFLEGNIDSEWILDVQKKQELSSHLLLKHFEDILNKKGYEVCDKKIVQGIPATEIIKYAKKKQIDLIVCGNKKYKKISRFLLGSVSLRVLENTESDVLIFK